MMIAAFARESRLSVDAVRLYVRRGMLHPEIGAKGGSHPYQVFSALDLEKARIIRAGQALGKRAFNGQEDDVVIAFLAEQRERLTSRIAELNKLVAFVDAKIGWLKDPSVGPSPPYPQ